MKLQYFTESAYTRLYDSISLNLENYKKSNDNTWIESLLGTKEYFKESRINATLPNLQYGTSSEIDYENVVLLYTALKDKLTPRQASNPYLWSYLTHNYYWDYSTNRWNPDDETLTKDIIRQRFFCGSESGGRVGFLRNSISRLWWAGYLTYLDNTSRPFELTELLFSNSDLVVSILERKFSMNKEVSIGILLAIKEINDNEKDSVTRDEWRELCKYINRYGAVTLLDSLSVEDVKQISKDYVLNYRNNK